MMQSAIAKGLIAAAVSFMAHPAAADEIADFYKGKNITVAIGFGAGGTYNAYARMIARHMPKHIPGNPVMVPQQMPGAGSRLAANWLYNVAPKDGTALAAIGENSALDQALKAEGIQFDVAKFNWIGNAIYDTNMTYSMASSGIVTIDDVLKKGGLICGGTGAASPSITSPMILNNMLNAKIRIISGYPGGGDVNLAMERGEVNCRGSNSWNSVKSTQRQWLDEKRINILVQFSTTKNPDISKYQGREVPTIVELAKTETDRKALRALVAGAVFGRSLVAPPGVPAARVAALRKAWEATLKDPELIAEADKSKFDINPVSGVELQKLAQTAAVLPPDVEKRVHELVAIKDVEELPAAKGGGKKK